MVILVTGDKGESGSEGLSVFALRLLVFLDSPEGGQGGEAPNAGRATAVWSFNGAPLLGMEVFYLK